MAVRHQVKITQARFKAGKVTPEQMIQIADKLRLSVRDRIRSGFNIYDSPAPPLTPKYAAYKVRRFGAQPIRDWFRTGRTWRSMQILSAGFGRAVIGFTDAVTNFRAFINNRRHRQFGVSPKDRVVLANAVASVLFPGAAGRSKSA